MLYGSLAALLAAFIPLVMADSPAPEIGWIGYDETRSRITLIDLDGSAPKVILESTHRYAAPEWTPDGDNLIVNGGSKLWRLSASGGAPTLLPTGAVPWVDINHSVSPDGKWLGFTAGPIWKVSAAGGEPVSITATSGNWLHAWSPDGKRLAFSANRGNGRRFVYVGDRPQRFATWGGLGCARDGGSAVVN